MKKFKKILAILLIINCVLINHISFALDNILERSTQRSAWHIDTNLKQTFYKENGIHIEGWKLSTEPGSKIIVSVDEKEISQKILKRRNDKPHAEQIFQVVFQSVEKRRSKTFIVKNTDEVFKTHKIRFSHTCIIGKCQIYHINDRDDRKYGINHKSRCDKK